jgi:hypothetical protein
VQQARSELEAMLRHGVDGGVYSKAVYLVPWVEFEDVVMLECMTRLLVRMHGTYDSSLNGVSI